MTALSYPDKRETAPNFVKARLHSSFNGECDACGQVFEYRSTCTDGNVTCLLCYFVDRIELLEALYVERQL